jgi:hypothetical protein
MLNLYVNPKKSNSAAMLDAFAEGAVAGGASVRLVKDGKYAGPQMAVFYGVQEETLSAWQSVRRTNTPYLFIDNGYFRSRWHGGDHFRITFNAFQDSGWGESDGERWRALGLQIKPWRGIGTNGARPLIALQTPWHYQLNGTSIDKWLGDVKRLARECGMPDPVVRGKDEAKQPIDWDTVSCVITHSSNMAVDAALEGIPSICTARCAGGYAGNDFAAWPDLKGGDHRERWAGVLADNQWSLSEIQNGVAYAALLGNTAAR